MATEMAFPSPMRTTALRAPHDVLNWATRAFDHVSLSPITSNPTPFPLPKNLTAATGNTYKNMYEATTMSSGLYFVLLVNLVVTWLGILFYRYVILREAPLLSPEELRLLRKYPSVRAAQSYTPSDAFVRAAPPMRWTGWRDFFTASETLLSRDAQVYLLFHRACILTTVICSVFATIVLLPWYWVGGAVFNTESESAPNSLLSLLQSDRGVFERFTSHNLPNGSPLILLQLPVIVVTALCIIVMYTVVKAAAGGERTIEEWLRSSAPLSPNTMQQLGDSPPLISSPKPKQWTVFARGLPGDIQAAGELLEMLNAIYPNQVGKVELICRGRMSEARLLRALSSARNRLEYIIESSDHPDTDVFPEKQGPFGRFFSLFGKRRTKAELIKDLEERIECLQKDFESRKAEPVRDFLGCAFITFLTPGSTKSALTDFPVRFERQPLQVRGRAGSDAYAGHEAEELIGPTQHHDLTIGRHSRAGSEWGLPRLQNLYRGTLNLLPNGMRQRIFASPNLVPTQLRDQSQAHDSLLGTIPEGVSMTPELATSKLRNMKAERAPKSGDIIWNNIGISFFERTVREMVVQFLVFTVLILFTSPVAMLTAMKLVFAEMALLSDPQVLLGHRNSTAPFHPFAIGVNGTNGFEFLNSLGSDGSNAVDSMVQDMMKYLPPFLSTNPVLRSALLGYLPVLLLAVVFAAVPTLLRMACSLEGYPTHSAQEMSVFRKTSFYYVMNAVVLPSLALNTASEFLEELYNQSGGGANVYNALPILQRLFSGDIAFFLCIYLVQLALSGSVFWLMRLPSSFSMMVRRRTALTRLEVAEAKCTDIFDYPRHYAYSVTAMSTCLLFGFMAPLIWYFALLYFLCKHAVDVYTLRYVHPRTHIDGRLPRLSANFILIWIAASQLSLAAIFYSQGWLKACIATVFLCILTLATCLSASANVGNRVLRILAMLRDRAIERVMLVAGSEYEWLPSSSLAASSSTSSSTQSLPDSRESDALLLKDPMVRRISFEIGSMKDLRTSSVISGSPSPRRAVSLNDPQKLIYPGPDSADESEEETEINSMTGFDASEDVELGTVRQIPQYGTCGCREEENQDIDPP